MSKLNELLQVSAEEKRKILQELETREEEFEKIAKNLKDWFAKNENFPKDDGFMDHRIKMALLNGKMSMEKAKQTLEAYFGLRVHYEDLFGRLIPNQRFKRVNPLLIHAVTPKLLPNLARLLIYRIEDIEDKALDVFEYYEILWMVSELRLVSEFCLSNEVLIDLRNNTFRKFVKHTPPAMQKLADILTSFGARISRIHCVNTPNFMDTMIAITRTVLPAKIMDRLIVHRSLDELYEYIPKDYLPSDFGGNLSPMREIHDDWAREIEFKAEMYEKLMTLRLKKSSKKTKEISPELGSGIDGSFRQLAID